MITFADYYKNKVKLSFDDHPFSKHPRHVWAICKYKGQWLLTKHKERGLEFPGGKVEKGETAEQAAVREIMEETGGKVEEIHYIGQYFVNGKSDKVIKNIYYAKIDKLVKQKTYHETEGPRLLKELAGNMKSDKSYSFIMKDEVLEHSIAYIKAKY